MERKLHEIKVRKARLKKRQQEKLIKIIFSIVIIMLIAFGSISIANAYGQKYQTIIIKKGDTVWSIAKHVNSVRDTRDIVNEIVNANNISPDFVKPGEKLIVPAS